MRKFLASIFAVLVTVAMIGSATAAELKMGTGGPTGNYFGMGNDIAMYCGDVLEPGRDGSSTSLSVLNSGGSVDNLMGMTSKEYSLGIVQQDVLQYMARRDADRVNSNRIKVITGMHAETVHLLIPKGYEPKSDGGLFSFDFGSLFGNDQPQGIDISLLKNQRVGSWGGSMVSAKAISLFLDLNFDVVEIPEDNRSSVRMPLILVGGQPYQVVEEYLKSGDWHLVGLNAEAIQTQAPFYMAMTANYTVDGRLQDIPTVGVRALLVGKAFRNEERNANMSLLANCIKDNLADLADDPSTNSNWGSVYEFEESDGQQINWAYFKIN